MDRLSIFCLLGLGLFLVLAAPASAQCTNTDPCAGQPDCSGCAQYDRVPDPSDCTRYYMCDGSGNVYDQPLHCDDGEMFDIASHDCVAGGGCTVCDFVCLYDCADSSQPPFVSSHDDCTLYYDCSNSPSDPPEECPEGTFYDGLSCQAELSRCCRCNPYCYLAGNVIANPLDCRKFYVCTAVGTPTDWGQCNDGLYFDSNTHSCSDTVSCYTACENVVDEDGCIDPFTCQESGYFAKCPDMCTPEYYYCSEASEVYPDVFSCDSGVYHPDLEACVSQSECPYPAAVLATSAAPVPFLLRA